MGQTCLIGSFVHIIKSIEDGAQMRGTPNVLEPKTTWDKFGIEKVWYCKKKVWLFIPDDIRMPAWGSKRLMLPVPVLHGDTIRIYLGFCNDDNIGQSDILM